MPQIINKSIGIFADAEESAHNFINNLLLSNTLKECVDLWMQAESEYEEAILEGDEDTIKAKKLQLQTYQSSVVLTAYILDEVDEIST